jgi:hypothetical protein
MKRDHTSLFRPGDVADIARLIDLEGLALHGCVAGWEKVEREEEQARAGRERVVSDMVTRLGRELRVAASALFNHAGRSGSQCLDMDLVIFRVPFSVRQ